MTDSVEAIASPAPASETSSEPLPQMPHPCLLTECTKELPGRGWCSKRHRDMWLREMGLTRTKRIPDNILVEIRKGYGYWYEAYQEAQRVAEATRQQQELARLNQIRESSNLPPVSEPIAMHATATPPTEVTQ